MIFPQNPTNKEIFESEPGIFYQYNTTLKSWFRINAPSIPLATPARDGLMSANDFKKLTGLIIPPPEISLTFEGCDTKFDEGLLELRGDDEGIIIIEPHEDKLHENTAVIDFKLDIEKFVEKMIDLEKLKLISPKGPKGDKGDPGDDGADALPVGPQGDDGKDGKNAPWPGSLSEETFDIAQQDKAIVDITTKEISENENYIIAKRANIGNLDACPNTIIPQDVQSPWILSIGKPSSKCKITSGTQTCGSFCNSELFYFDIDTILQGIESQFTSYLNSIKNEKEQIANTWLAAMQAEFNEQKSALCCALEACRSKSRNERTRQYIEQQRIQAAMGDFQLVIGDDEEKHFPPLDNNGECTWNIPPANFNLIHLSDPDCEIDWPSICPDIVK